MDINMWLETHFDLKPTSKHGWLNCNCPFCVDSGRSPDTKFHLGINTERNQVHCFRCHYKRSLAGFIMQIEHCSFTEAYQIIGGHIVTRNRLSLVKPRFDNPSTRETELPREYHRLNPKNPRHKGAINYLMNRGISLEVAEDLQYGFAVTGDYAQRIIIPVLFEGNVVGYTARTILSKDAEKVKYKTSPGFPSNRYLYNFDTAKEFDNVVLMEGPLDVVKLPMMAVGLFTNQMSDAQMLQITATWPRVYIMLDRDAQQEAAEIFRRLRMMTECWIAVLPKSKDPGEAPALEIAGAMSRAHKEIWI